MIPVLEAGSLNLVGHPMRLYRLLQHLSSVVGLLVLALVVWRWHRALPAAELPGRRELGKVERYAWLAVGILIPLSAAASAALRGLHGLGRTHDLGDWLTFTVEAGMGATAASVVAVSVLLRLRLGMRHR
jgi:hypothetical protein